ncbi:MAG: DUF2156 domain-containing protein, partial [Thermodesulfobacteriota bacterium]
DYPEFEEITLADRKSLHPFFSSIKSGVSEFTFANVYFFRHVHNYRVAKIKDSFIFSGQDNGKAFFMTPAGLPEEAVLKQLFERFSSMKCATEDIAVALAKLGYKASEDRDNFDYLYLREDMTSLSGRKFHKKKNLVNAFMSNYSCEGMPLTEERHPDALTVLNDWRMEREDPGDYDASREALEKMEELSLCGSVYYVDHKPAAYTLGEELGRADTFAVHFEKGSSDYKGLLQFVSQAFASLLPEKYVYINREQDLGIEGLRQTKLSLRPSGFIKKYRAGT